MDLEFDFVVSNMDKHHVAMPRLYDLGDTITQPNMYRLEVTRSSVESRYCTREHLLEIRQ